ncbi:MAG: hypothetical protein CBC22_03640 [Alphaproteobacteria bacterium TMED62]|nr:MAG: hypothetical protein CBC22_03640 [Alphaproteobacteria bacterium TMED62]|tara:strand:+ start:940 stop:1539 length:600 start_codon:yes stop_codon:yes gene_type:complete
MGRSSSLKVYDVIQKCMYKYWEKGINFFSFNSIISYSEVSKPSMYRLVGNEDNLKRKSLLMYYEKHLSKNHYDIENATSLFELTRKKLNNIQNKKDGITDINLGLCYFQKTRIIKYTLDRKTQNLVNRIDLKFTKSYIKLINKLKAENHINKSVNSEFLAQFIYNNTTFFVNAVQNSLSMTEIENLKNSILDTIKYYSN